jgi:hypothetical protein
MITGHQELAGRDRELETLTGLLAEDGPAAIWLHGIAGSGKTALVRAFARANPGAVTIVDGSRTEPTEAGFLAALGTPSGGVIAIDGHHHLNLIDSWLRLELLPSLPRGARLLITSRGPAPPAWHAELGPQLRTLPLGPLAPPAAEALLRRAGRSAADARELNRFAHGHPLSLLLAAAAPALPTVADTLAGLYLDGLDPATRRALDAACVTRRTTLSLLEATLPGEPAAEAFSRLRALPFTELGADGLVIQDTVREAAAAMLRAGDPAAHRRLKVAAWHHLRAEMRDAAPSDMWRYTADMLYLVENPLVRDIYFPTTAPQHAYEPARDADWPGIEAIVRAHEPDTVVDILRRYRDGARFRVARDEAGDVRGFHVEFVPREVSPRAIDADPVASAWREHLRREPLPHGQIALFIRHWGTRVGGRDPAPGEPSICLDLKRTYLELRPALGRVYLPICDLGEPAEQVAAVGFARAPAHDARIGGETYHAMVADFGTGSFDGWLAALGARELGIQERDPLHELDLTRLERGVLAHLRAHPGRVVARAELFEAVWGTAHMGDGNALEAVVSTLRRKLGPRAKALETVRGAGYRLRELS